MFSFHQSSYKFRKCLLHFRSIVFSIVIQFVLKNFFRVFYFFFSFWFNANWIYLLNSWYPLWKLLWQKYKELFYCSMLGQWPDGFVSIRCSWNICLEKAKYESNTIDNQVRFNDILYIYIYGIVWSFGRYISSMPFDVNKWTDRIFLKGRSFSFHIWLLSYLFSSYFGRLHAAGLWTNRAHWLMTSVSCAA